MVDALGLKWRTVKQWSAYGLIDCIEVDRRGHGSTAFYGVDTWDRLRAAKWLLTTVRDLDCVRLRMWLLGLNISTPNVKESIRKIVIDPMLSEVGLTVDSQRPGTDRAFEIAEILLETWRHGKGGISSYARKRLQKPKDRQSALLTILALSFGAQPEFTPATGESESESLGGLFHQLVGDRSLTWQGNEFSASGVPSVIEGMNRITRSRKFSFFKLSRLVERQSDLDMQGLRGLFLLCELHWGDIGPFLESNGCADLAMLVQDLDPRANAKRPALFMLAFAILFSLLKFKPRVLVEIARSKLTCDADSGSNQL